jgi:hypothetical protein
MEEPAQFAGWRRSIVLLKFEAEILVAHLRPRICAVAVALVEHRHLNADQIARYATV